jgi:hypothetical protein
MYVSKLTVVGVARKHIVKKYQCQGLEDHSLADVTRSSSLVNDSGFNLVCKLQKQHSYEGVKRTR